MPWKFRCGWRHLTGSANLTKQPAFHDSSTGFPAKWRPSNEHRNSILMTCYYPDLGGASDWLKQISIAAQPIRSTTLISVVIRNQYEICAFVSQTSFRGETSGEVAQCGLFYKTKNVQNVLDLSQESGEKYIYCSWCQSLFTILTCVSCIDILKAISKAHTQLGVNIGSISLFFNLKLK